MVLGFFKRRNDTTPYTIYQSVAEASRQPVFYETLGVTDSISGRFDMLITHAVLVLRRLARIEGERREEAASRSQAFSDILFRDLDRALRDTGVSDRKVPKKLKLLAEAYLGRGQAFGNALDAGDTEALADALGRNSGGIVFKADKLPEDDDEEGASAMNTMAVAAYVRAADIAIGSQSDADVLEGTFAWPDAQQFAAIENRAPAYASAETPTADTDDDASAP
ncbi:MAG: ubiquinol-cytochrome C chaperone [Devosiaceae bacterium]|nr:ubiquinol-cytochrome C chaperone [Devosiaceae bacterium MH13]